MEHVRVRHHDVATLLERGAPAGRGVAVVRVGSQLDRKAMLESAQLGQLVLSQGLRRKQVKRSPLRVLEQALEYRQVVAERLAAGRRRHHDQVPSLADRTR